MSQGHIRPQGKGSWEIKFDLGRDPTFSDRLDKRPIIATVLGTVFGRELADRIVEGLTRTHVAGDHRSIAGAGMCAGQGVCTHPRVLSQNPSIPVLDDRGHLHVA